MRGVMVEVMRMSRLPRRGGASGIFEEPAESEETEPEQSSPAPVPEKDYTESREWSLADLLHSILPESLSGRKGVVQKRERLKRLEEETQP